MSISECNHPLSQDAPRICASPIPTKTLILIMKRNFYSVKLLQRNTTGTETLKIFSVMQANQLLFNAVVNGRKNKFQQVISSPTTYQLSCLNF